MIIQKQAFIEEVTASIDQLSLQQVWAVVDAVTNTLTRRLRAGDDVRLFSFGTFSVKETAARDGRNPKTGEKIAIPAGRRVAFKPSRSVLD